MPRQKCLCSLISHEASRGTAFTPTLFRNGTKWLFKAGISNPGPNAVFTPVHVPLQPMNVTAESLRGAAGHYYINYLQIDQAISGWNRWAPSRLFSISYWSLTQPLRRADSYAWQDSNAWAIQPDSPYLWHPPSSHPFLNFPSSAGSAFCPPPPWQSPGNGSPGCECLSSLSTDPMHTCSYMALFSLL